MVPTDSSVSIFPGLEFFPQPTKSDCSSCEALWREYRDAMISHLESVDQLDLAQFIQNVRRTLYLEGVVFRAERKRDEARTAALAHEKTHQKSYRDRLAA